MVPSDLQQVDGVQGPSPQPSLQHENEEHSMPMADQGSREESAVRAEASSGSSGQEAQHDDGWDNQQQEEVLQEHEAAELDARQNAQQEQYQAAEEEGWQQDDRPGYQQLPELAHRQRAAGVD